ncbi:MAG: hypothetical protein IRZ33_11555 [Alicyclobacillaceae bacterium]|nr:hypothetical protein [Alicyclobacillaceae bacterium]
MSLRRYVRRFVGQHVQCHTFYGTFQGVVIRCTKHHIILAPIPAVYTVHGPWPHPRQFPVGPVGPGGPGPGWGSGWQIAIPLAAIVGITALGMHWW